MITRNMDMEYKYFCKGYPPAPGTVPGQNLLRVVDYDEPKEVEGIGYNIKGEAYYSLPLTEKDIQYYELVPVPVGRKPGNKLFVNADNEKVMEFVKKVVCLKKTDKTCACDACKALEKGANPDILIVNVDNKDEVAVVPFRKLLNSFYFTAKNMSNFKCLVIPDMDKLSVASQNTMLKFIEDNNDKAVVVGNCSDLEKIIPTVRSRMIVDRVKVHLSFDEFEKWCFSHCIGESVLYYSLTGGDISKVDKAGTCMDIWKNLIKILPDKTKMKEVFKLLHLVKENDKDAFCEKHPDMVIPMFMLMQQIFIGCIQKAHGEKPKIEICNDNWSLISLFDNIMVLSDGINKAKKNSYKAKDLTSFLIRMYKQI